MAVTFFVKPSSLSLNVRGSVSSPSAAAVGQEPGSVNDKTRVSWNPGSSTDGHYFHLTGTMPTVTQDHGGITKVELLARAYRSGIGPDNWDLTESCFMALGVDANKDGAWFNNLSHWYLPDWHTYEGFIVHVGKRMDSYYWNRNTQPNPLSVYQWTWDITNLRTWDNAALSGFQVRLSGHKTQQISGGFNRAGWQRPGGGNTPRWDVSQMILRVTAADPPIPYATGTYFLGG